MTIDNVTLDNLAAAISSLTMTGALTMQQPTAATGGANQSSNVYSLQGTFWNGSASATDTWQLQIVLGAGTNPTSTLTLTHSGSSGAANFSVPGNHTIGGTLGVTGEASFGQTDTTGYLVSVKDTTSNPVSALHVGHSGTAVGAYGVEVHNFADNASAPTPGTGAETALTVHQYSDAGPAVIIDNTRSQTLISLRNALNNVTSNGTFGSGNFFDFSGFPSDSPATRVSLGQLNKDLTFGTRSNVNTTWSFGDGLAVSSGSSTIRAALAVSSANTSFPGISVNETASSIYAISVSSLTHGQNVTYSGDGGEGIHLEKDGTGAGTALKIVNKGTGDSILVTDGTNNKWEVTSAGKVATYNGIATAGSGLLPEYATPIDLTNQNAAIPSNTVIYAVPASGAGFYMVVWYAKVTTAASGGSPSSTLGPLTLSFTDATDSVGLAETLTSFVAAGGTATSTSGNTNTTLLNGATFPIYCKASTNITYSFGYATAGTTPMQYELHIRLIGPF